ncbi:hypothetical protein cypCar_00021492 [Cyprinus carpio]|nr:hypothetical protein cypCar_00021492 [Cyprinus carpio]
MSDLLKTRCEDSSPQPPRKQQPPAANGTDKQQETVCSRLQSWFYDRFGVYIEDFRFQPEENTVEAEEPLSAKRLVKKDHLWSMAWLGYTFVSILSHSEVVIELPHSQNHTVYVTQTNSFNTVLFFFRGWRIQWSIVPEVSEPVEPPKEDLTVSEKFQLVLDVAQKAQVNLHLNAYRFSDFYFNRKPVH